MNRLPITDRDRWARCPSAIQYNNRVLGKVGEYLSPGEIKPRLGKTST